MSGHPHTIHLPQPERLGAEKIPLALLFGGMSTVGLFLCLVGYFVNHTQFAYSWFFGFYYFMSIALGSFFWVTLHYACDSCWDTLVRRVWENILALFPVLLLLFLPLLFVFDLGDTLWKWMPASMASDPEVMSRNKWFDPTFFYVRVFLYFAYFCLAGLYYRRESILQDKDGNPIYTLRMHKHSYLALVIFGLLQAFLGNDWLSNLDWKWASSLFGVYTFAVSVQSSLAACIVLIAIFRGGGYLQALNSEHYYLMGKLLFGFTIFWAYIAFGQYLLIWYANIPEETIFYNDHNRGNWIYLTYFLAAGKFIFPVCYLLSQDVKKSLRSMTFISLWVLFMHGCELYWFIGPYAHRGLCPSWQDFVCLFTVGSILAFAYVLIAGASSLFPAKDPRMVECLTITN